MPIDDDIIQVLTSELDNTVTEVMAERCKRPDLTDEQGFDTIMERGLKAEGLIKG